MHFVNTLCFSSVADGREYCHTEQFTASCPDSQLILVTAARYGRMSVGRCVKTNFGFIGCSKVVTQQVHQRCSGRPSCAIRIPEPVLDQTKPCNEDLKSYLDVNYTCIRGAVWHHLVNNDANVKQCIFKATSLVQLQLSG